MPARRLGASEPVAFRDFPPEIIEEVFFHLPPDNVLDWKQPDVTIAPILLCHVCSQWRFIALQSRRLWMRLYRIVRLISSMRNRLKSEIHPLDLGFLGWWRSNLGANPLHLRFDIKFEGWIYFPSKDELPEQVLDLFPLVRHLELDWFTTYGIYDTYPKGFITSPHLETLRIRSGDLYEIAPFCYELPIRKLHIPRVCIKEPGDFTRHALSWASLNYIVFLDVHLSSGIWFDLVRACVNLQSACFKTSIVDPIEEFRTPYFTHHHLRQLVIAWHPSLDHGEYLLKNLFFPSLTALRIPVSLTAKQLHCILESMPSLVELHLGWKAATTALWYSPSGDGAITRFRNTFLTCNTSSSRPISARIE